MLVLFASLAVLGALCCAIGFLAHYAKSLGIAEAEKTEAEQDLEAVTAIMKEAKEDETLREKTIANSKRGLRPASLRKYDR